MIMKQIVLGVILCLFSSAYADAGAPMIPLDEVEKGKVTAALRALSEKTETIKSDFIQTKHLMVLADTIVSRGRFYYKKSDHIRWEYVKPFSYIIIYAETKIHIDDEGKKHTFDAKSNRIFDEINRMVLAAIKGQIAESASYKIAYFRSGKRYAVKMIPATEEMGKYIISMEVFFDERTFSVVELNLYEKSGDYTNIKFTGRMINVELPEKIFDTAP
jgi:outer membrane lipoprotein carrier protein